MLSSSPPSFLFPLTSIAQKLEYCADKTLTWTSQFSSKTARNEIITTHSYSVLRVASTHDLPLYRAVCVVRVKPRPSNAASRGALCCSLLLVLPSPVCAPPPRDVVPATTVPSFPPLRIRDHCRVGERRASRTEWSGASRSGCLCHLLSSSLAAAGPLRWAAAGGQRLAQATHSNATQPHDDRSGS